MTLKRAQRNLFRLGGRREASLRLYQLLHLSSEMARVCHRFIFAILVRKSCEIGDTPVKSGGRPVRLFTLRAIGFHHHVEHPPTRRTENISLQNAPRRPCDASHAHPPNTKQSHVPVPPPWAQLNLKAITVLLIPPAAKPLPRTETGKARTLSGPHSLEKVLKRAIEPLQNDLSLVRMDTPRPAFDIDSNVLKRLFLIRKAKMHTVTPSPNTLLKRRIPKINQEVMLLFKPVALRAAGVKLE